MFSEAFLNQLNRLHYAARDAVTGRVGGQHRSRRAGLSLDFAEHRAYLPGDDFRAIDWNLYGRLDRLFVKVFLREEDYPVYALLDRSRSMAVGNKLDWALRLTAALGYVALKDHNRFGVYPFAQDLALEDGWRARAGWKRTLGLFSYLEGLSVDSHTDLNCALRQFAGLELHRGLVLVLSDLFCEDGYDEGLLALRGAGHAVVLLHVLAEEDLVPALSGEVWLTPAEGVGPRRLGGPEAQAGYTEALTRYLRRLEAFSHHHELAYVRLTTGRSAEETVLERLRGRVLR